MKTLAYLSFSLLLLLATACSTPDNTEPPAELTEIKAPEKVRRLWSIDTGKGIDEGFSNIQPLVHDKLIYTIDMHGLIKQIDPKRGRINWQYETGLSAISGMAADMKGLVVTTLDGDLVRYDFDEKTLKLLWQQQLSSEIRSRAVIALNQVFIKTTDGKLSAFNSENGELMWTVSRRVPPLSLTGNSFPIVTEDLVISGFDNGKLVAFERDNGTTVWETSVSTPVGRTEIERLVDLDGQFILRDGIIYISSYQGNLVAITLNNGQVIWSRKFSSFQAIDADDEALYLTDDRSHIWSIDRRTGSAFWKQEVLNARKVTAPRIVGDRLIVADLEGYVHWFDKQSGKLVARKATADKRYLSQPVNIDNTVFVLDSTHQLTALTQER